MKRSSFCLIALVLVCLAFTPDNDIAGYRHQLQAPAVTVTLKKPSFALKKPQEKKYAEYILPVLQPAKGGQVRGALLGMTKPQIQNLEREGELFSENDTLVVYSQILGMDSSRIEFADIAYRFDDKSVLKKIEVEYYLKEEAVAKGIYESYMQQLVAKYGPADVDLEGYSTWQTIGFRGKKILIRLKDVSKPADAGLRLRFQHI